MRTKSKLYGESDEPRSARPIAPLPHLRRHAAEPVQRPVDLLPRDHRARRDVDGMLVGVLAQDAALLQGGAEIAGRILMRRSAAVTDARRIEMRPLLACAVSIDGILENMGPMRSLAAEAHREIIRRYDAIMLDLHERRAVAGAGT